MFGLDPQNTLHRAGNPSPRTHIPTLRESLWRGTIGFTLVSLAGFAPWVLAGRWFYRNVGEAGLYAVCALVFIGSSGVLLHRLIIGPGSLVRFYKIFSLSFLAYAVAWTIGWMLLGGLVGSAVGLLAGAAAMGSILSHGFSAREVLWKVISVLFVSNAVGYFAGEWAHNVIPTSKDGAVFSLGLAPSTLAILAKAAWGLFYGLGFGAGIGFAFYVCQEKVRKLLQSS